MRTVVSLSSTFSSVRKTGTIGESPAYVSG
jgi:hypothetical protein